MMWAVPAGKSQDAATAQLLPPMLRALFWQLTMAARTSSLPLAVSITGLGLTAPSPLEMRKQTHLTLDSISGVGVGIPRGCCSVKPDL